MTHRRDVIRGTAAAAAGAKLAAYGVGGRCALAGQEKASLLTFNRANGKTAIETLWWAPGGQWDWNRSMPFAADIGSQKNQPCFLYGLPDSRTALFAFDGMLKPKKLWESAAGDWSLDRSIVATADVHGKGQSQIYVLYGYPEHRAALYKLDEAFKPQKLWDTGGPNTWIWIYTRLFSADFDGNGKTGLSALYQNGSKFTNLFVDLALDEKENKTDGLWSLSPRFCGIGQFGKGQGNPIVLMADFRGTGRKELSVWYERPDDSAVLVVFDKTHSPQKVWESGAHGWAKGCSQVVAADFNGTGRDELCVLYANDKTRPALYVFDDALKPRKIWESPAGQLSFDRSRLFTAALPGSPRALCALAKS